MHRNASFYSSLTGGALENQTTNLLNDDRSSSSSSDILLANEPLAPNPPAAFVTPDRRTTLMATASSGTKPRRQKYSQMSPGGASSRRRFLGSLLIQAIASGSVALFGNANDASLVSLFTLYFWTLVGSIVGFHLYLYFISVGHALAIFLPVFLTLVRYSQRARALSRAMSPAAVLHSLLVLLWSLRLGIFLLWREYVAWPALQGKLRRVAVDRSQKITAWFLYSFLALCMVTPCWWRLQWDLLPSSSSLSPWSMRWKAFSVLGIALQITGLFLESLADWQKSAFKAASSGEQKWCHVGLWKYSTHPNYAGEWLFWLGTLTAVLPTRRGAPMALRLLMLTGFLVRSLILQGAARKLDQRHAIQYAAAADEDWRAFFRTTGLLGPRIHWYRYWSQWWRRRSSSFPNDALASLEKEEEQRRTSATTVEALLDSTLAATEDIDR